MYQIVPLSYNPADTAETKAAVDAGLVRPIHLEQQDQIETSKKSEKFLQNLPLTPAGHTFSSSLLIEAIAAYADFKKKAAVDNPYGAAYLEIQKNKRYQSRDIGHY